jgi:hypothetical protein
MLVVKRGSAIMEMRQRRGWIPVVAITFGFALLLMLEPHDLLTRASSRAAHTVSELGGLPRPTAAHSGGGADFAAILPLLFVGVISPLLLLAPLAFGYAGRVPEARVLVPSFQRPPPSRRR